MSVCHEFAKVDHFISLEMISMLELIVSITEEDDLTGKSMALDHMESTTVDQTDPPDVLSFPLNGIEVFAAKPTEPSRDCSFGSEGCSGLSQVMLLIVCKSRSDEALIGWMLELLTHDVGMAVVDMECLAKELNCSAFLNPVHRRRLFKCVNDMPSTMHCRSMV